MALFAENEVRNKARNIIQKDRLAKGGFYSRSADELLSEQTAVLASGYQQEFDIFLSHSSKDAELILGVKIILEELGYRVYVDWINDRQLSRDNVTPETAHTLRARMRSSKSLFYVTTQNAITSKWMPWECGYFDGLKEKVAILPVKNTTEYYYYGQEYLGLYPYSTKGPNAIQQDRLWIERKDGSYLLFEEWVSKKNSELEWKRR